MNLINLAVAFGAGVISITSPCCLPLLPGYLAYLTGMSSANSEPNRRRTLVAAILFVFGFSFVFIGLGATASILGSILLTYRLPVAQIAGFFILAMGLFLLLEGRIALLSRGGDWSRRFAGGKLWTAPLLGAAFAITWTPCIGPVLAAILTLAASTPDLDQGVVLLAAYSIGLGVPFVVLSFSVPTVRNWLHRVRWAPAILQQTSGALLVAMGFLLVTDLWLPLIAPVLSWYAQARWPPI